MRALDPSFFLSFFHSFILSFFLSFFTPSEAIAGLPMMVIPNFSSVLGSSVS